MSPTDLPLFVQFGAFPQTWRMFGLDYDDLRDLELLIIDGPDRAPVIVGTGGLRKIRFSPRGSNRGKSSGMRVYYAYFADDGVVALLFAHDKQTLATITEAAKKVVKWEIEMIRVYLKRRRGKEPLV